MKLNDCAERLTLLRVYLNQLNILKAEDLSTIGSGLPITDSIDGAK